MVGGGGGSYKIPNGDLLADACVNASRRIITNAKRNSIFKKYKSINVWVTDKQTYKWNQRLKIFPLVYSYKIGPG